MWPLYKITGGIITTLFSTACYLLNTNPIYKTVATRKV